MTELERLFASAKQMPSPNLWPDIELRGTGQGVDPRVAGPPRTRARVTSASIAIAAALAAFIFLWNAFGGQTQTAMVSPSATSLPTGLSEYSDPSGWTADYPSTWTVMSIPETSDGLGSGTTISNLSPEHPSDPRLVFVTIAHRLGAEPNPSIPSTRLPLSTDDFGVSPGPSNTSTLEFSLGGIRYLATMSVGAETSTTDIAAVSNLVASIRPTEEISPTVYSDPAGWSIEVPAGWTASHHAFDVNQGATIEGVVTGTPIDVSIDHYASGYVETPGDMTYPHDDRSLPLDPGELQPGEGGPRMWFMDGGTAFRIQVGSRSTLEPEAQQVVDEMIRSITFAPWQESQVRNGWRALNGFDGDPKAMQQAGMSWQCWGADACYVVWYQAEVPIVLGPIPTCGEGENMTADSSSYYWIVLECPDGTTQAWAGTGEPSPANTGAFASGIDQHRLIRTWDGTLLTNTHLDL